jgi:hypothetical protein
MAEDQSNDKECILSIETAPFSRLQLVTYALFSISRRQRGLGSTAKLSRLPIPYEYRTGVYASCVGQVSGIGSPSNRPQLVAIASFRGGEFLCGSCRTICCWLVEVLVDAPKGAGPAATLWKSR